ncbi:heparinase II/III family protein [Luteimonas aquatica]|uniref:heparinase II/III family protein n=1 Tax=Luteimonas aquatica TaxID=450364 RepID=UPI001F593953|nr:heparinase II/III family protein [Luteimonas aquatica]
MNWLSRSAQFWHTVRYLRPVQVYGRAWHRLHRPRVDARAAPSPSRRAGDWQGCDRAASMLGPMRFRFLNEEHTLRLDDWNSDALPKLWLYNLHYFDDLNADGAAERVQWHRAMISRWIAANPPGHGNGWEPYCLSLRIVNWIKWQCSERRATNGNAQRAMLDSLATQARYLRGRLERHLLGNHLWANLKALLFAGAFFEGAEAARWREAALREFRRELGEQILADGGHFERSPMYHAILLEDLLDLVQLAQRFPGAFGEHDVALWRDNALRMLRWLAVMTHPDGGIAFFNDAALGIAPTLAQLSAYAARLGVAVPPASAAPVQRLPDSGYVRLQNARAVVIADVGEIGPDYLPGHAHADTLSFELSVDGRRVLVNAGTSCYDSGPERLWQRGTAAHNTVEVDGQDSSEVWSSFRVARRARPLAIDTGASSGGIWLTAAHDGYRRLPGRPLHRRRWDLREDGLLVEDTVEGDHDSAIARFRVAPGFEVDEQALREEDGARIRWSAEGARRTQVASGFYHPEFGLSRSCSVIEATLLRAGMPMSTLLRWQD